MTTGFESRFGAEYDGEIPASVDEAALERMEIVAHALDESIPVPGTDASVGIDPVLGVFPVVGDLVSAGLSLYIVAESANLGVSYTTLLRMLGNLALDTVVGSVPYIGTLFDSLWKANKRNVERALEELAEQSTGGSNDDYDPEAAVEIPIQSD